MDFKVKTNWCVITGAPSSGKTSVINVLAARGYAVEHEVARAVMEIGLDLGYTLDQVRGNSEVLQSVILAGKLAREKKMEPSQLAFLDRGIPDSLSYFRLASMDADIVYRAAREFHYRHVFIFDRLKVQPDGIRTESDEMGAEIDRALERDYRELGYTPVRVPVVSVEARADFILERVTAAG